jgi:hypothetical protein
MSGQFGGVQLKIREFYPHAYYIHCYAHQLNLIIKRAASVNKKVKIFFSNLEGFSSFFSMSPKRTAFLDEIVKKRLPRAAPTRWNFKSRQVNTIFENKDLLKECLETIVDSVDDTKTINEATGLISFLNNEDFVFWLEVFHRIMPHTDILFSQMQKRSATGPYMAKCLTAFENEIQKVRNNIDSIIINTIGAKRARHTETVAENRVTAAKEVCDVITTQLKDRFAFRDYLTTSNLLLTENFETYKTNFPEHDFQTATQCYPYFDVGKLRTELNTLYKRDDMNAMDGVCTLLKFLEENELKGPFSKIYKLCNIVATTPMNTAESERCFSTLKRVKTFLRNSMSQYRLSALAMLSIEKTMIKNIKNFNNQVIDIFVRAKERRADFVYK